MRDMRMDRFQFQTLVLPAGEPCGQGSVMLQNLVVDSWSGRGILCGLERVVTGRGRFGSGFFCLYGLQFGNIVPFVGR